MRFFYTRHARQRMVLRGISRREVEEAGRLGAKSHQDGRLISAYRYFEVVYQLRKGRWIIITVKPRW